MKKIAIGFGAIVALIVIALLAVPALIDWNGYKPQIAAAVKDATGRDLIIEGDISFSILPRLRFSAGGVKFANAPGVEPPYMATVERIEGEVALLPLLGRTIVVQRLSVEKPEADLHIDAEGNPNWAFTGTSQADGDAAAEAEGGGFSGDVRIENASIVGGRIGFTDARTGQKIDARAIAVDVSMPSLADVAAFDARMEVNGDPVQAHVSLDTPRRLMSGEKAAAVLAFEAPKAEARYEGGVQNEPVPGLDGRFDLDIPSVGALVAWLGRPLPKGQPDPGPVKAHAVFTADGPRMALTEAVLEGRDLKAEASGSVDLSGPAPKVVLAVESGVLDLDRYLPPAPQQKLKAPARKTPSSGGMFDGLSDEALDLDMLRQGEADIRVNIAGIRALGFVVGPTAFAAKLQGGKLDAELSRLQLYGGTVTARTAMDASGKTLTLNADAAVDKVDVGALAKAATPQGQAPVTGVVSATLEAAGSGASPKALAESLKGRLTADLGGMNLGAATAGALSGLNLDVTLPGVDSPPKLVATFVYNRERVEVEAQTSPLSQVVSDDRFDLDASVRSSMLTAGYDGAVIKAPAGLDGKVDLDVPSIGRLAAWLGQPLDPKQPDPGPLNVAATLAADGPRIALREATIEGKALKATAEGSIDPSTVPRQFAAKVAVQQADLDAYLPPEGAAKPQQPPGQPAAGTGWSEEPIDLAVLRDNAGQVDVTLEDVRYRGLVVEQGRMTATLKGGALTASLADMRTAGGSIAGKATIADTGQGVRLDYDASASGLAARPLLTAFAGSDRLSGTAAFAAKGTGAGRSQKDLMESLDGTGSFEFLDGAIHGINIAALLRQVGAAGLSTDAGAEQKTDFAELSGSYVIREGIVENRDLKMLAPLLRLGGGGTVNMPQQTLDYTVDATLVSSLKGQGGKEELAGIPVPIRISGAWSNPRWDVQWDRMLQNLAKDPERLKNLPGSLQDLAKGAGIAIPGLGGEADGSGGLGGVLPGAPGTGQKGPAAPGADLLRGLLGGGEPKTPTAPTGKTAPQQREPAPGPRSLQPPEPEQREPTEPERMLRGLFGR